MYEYDNWSDSDQQTDNAGDMEVDAASTYMWYADNEADDSTVPDNSPVQP